jgi:hypothetical protein
MRFRRITVLALSVIITASVAYRLSDGNPGSSDGSQSVAGPSAGFVAYYFHGDARCTTCRTIEAYAHEAITAAFAPELEDGTLLWRAINIEKPGNEHFVADFRLDSRSVVVAEMRDGAVTRSKVLDRVWHVVGDKPEFTAYIREEIRRFMAGGDV